MWDKSCTTISNNKRQSATHSDKVKNLLTFQGFFGSNLIEFKVIKTVKVTCMLLHLVLKIFFERKMIAKSTLTFQN